MKIASASTTVKFHEFPSGTVVHNYQPGAKIDGPIRSISWSRDGNWLAVTPYSGQIEIITIKDQLKLLRQIQSIEEPTCAAFFNTTKRNLAIGTRTNQLLIYDIKLRGIKKKFRTNSIVNQVEVLAKDGHIVALCGNGEALLFSDINNVLAGTYRVPKSDNIEVISCCPIKKNYICAGTIEGYVAVWDINNKNKTKFFNNIHKAPVTAVAFSPINSDLLVSTGLDRQCCFYDVEANKCLTTISVENSIMSIDFSPNGKYIAMGTRDGNVAIYDSRKIIEPMHTYQAHNSSITHLMFQKGDDIDDSDFSIVGDDFVFAHQTSSSSSSGTSKPTINVNDHHETRNNNDSLSLFVGIDKRKSPILNSTKIDDSFMAEMGLAITNNNPSNQSNNNKYDNSFGGGDGGLSNKGNISKLTTPDPQRIKDKLLIGGLNDKKKPDSSTPKYQNQEIELPTVSPLLNDLSSDIRTLCKESIKGELKGMMDDLQTILKDEVKNTIPNIVKEEFKNIMEQWKEINTFSHYETRCQIRQVHYNLQMYLVKEAIKMEEVFNNLRSEMGNDHDGLYEENQFLKRRIEELEAQLANLQNDNQIN